MKIIHTDGTNKDLYKLCELLDTSLNDNVPNRKAAGLNSLYNIENIKDVFLLYDEKRAVGSACLWQHDEQNCELIRVYIADEYRGRGLVGMLVEKVEGLAKTKGYEQIMLRTWTSTPYSIRAYEKLGYSLVPAKMIKHTDKFARALALADVRVYMVKSFKQE